jgi:RNA polymerase sigma-70 factor (ECF subfamily)
VKPAGALARITVENQEPGQPLDEDITALIRAGRPDDALALLVPAYRRRVFGLAYGILRNRAAAEDVAQEVFVKLWQALGGYDGRAQLSTWIYAITRNASISALRKRPRSASLSDPEVSAQADMIEASGPAPDAEDSQLWRLVEALPDKQRQVVTLYYQDDRPTEEVAEMLGLPVNTVKTHLHRARARLAAALGAEQEFAA